MVPYNLTLFLPKVSISRFGHANQTNYFCAALNASEFFDQRYHITRFEVLNKPSESHHLIIYNCPRSTYLEYSTKKLFECSSGIATMSCTVYSGWAFGLDAMDVPKNIGVPFGG